MLDRSGVDEAELEILHTLDEPDGTEDTDPLEDANLDGQHGGDGDEDEDSAGDETGDDEPGESNDDEAGPEDSKSGDDGDADSKTLMHGPLGARTVNVAQRPNSAGVPEEVGFAIEVHHVNQINLAASTFAADLVLTFQWTDPRTKALLEQDEGGHGEDLILSQRDATKRIWMPQMIVSNRALTPPQVVSTTIRIESTGVITKTQRLVVPIKTKMSIKEYPYDTHDLKIKVSSAKYMAGELKLKDMGLTYLRPGALDGSGFDLQSNSTHIDEMGGNIGLNISAGYLEFKVTRDKTYWEAPLYSLLMVTACGYLVFWMPMTAPFIMPRVTLSVLSLLTVMSMRSTYLSFIKGTVGMSRGEIYFASCMVTLFAGIAINLSVEFVYHEMKMPILAERLHQEVRLLFPFLLGINMFECARLSQAGWPETFVLVFLFACRCFISVQSNLSTAASEEEPTEADAAKAATSNLGADEGKSSMP